MGAHRLTTKSHHELRVWLPLHPLDLPLHHVSSSFFCFFFCCSYVACTNGAHWHHIMRMLSCHKYHPKKLGDGVRSYTHITSGKSIYLPWNLFRRHIYKSVSGSATPHSMMGQVKPCKVLQPAGVLLILFKWFKWAKLPHPGPILFFNFGDWIFQLRSMSIPNSLGIGFEEGRECIRDIKKNWKSSWLKQKKAHKKYLYLFVGTITNRFRQNSWTPWKINIENLQITQIKWKTIFQTSIFGFHAKFSRVKLSLLVIKMSLSVRSLESLLCLSILWLRTHRSGLKWVNFGVSMNTFQR